MLEIQTIRDLDQAFAEIMSNSFARYKEENKVAFGTGSVKTYMMDADLTGFQHNRHDGIHSYLSSASESLGCLIQPLSDENFFRLVRTNKGGKQSSFFLRAIDERYWLLQTVVQVGEADRFYRDLTKLPQLDSTWFPMQSLRYAGHIGTIKAFTSRFDNAPFAADYAEAIRESLTMKLWGRRAVDFLSLIDALDALDANDYEAASKSHGVLNLLAALKRIKDVMSVSGVRVRHRLSPEEPAEMWSNNDLNYNGKITAFGQSFVSHLEFVSQTISRYKITIEAIERLLPIRANEQGRFQGVPIIVEFGQLQFPVKEIVNTMFNQRKPFRLWGQPSIYDDDFARVMAVDLHSGHSLSFDISQNYISIMLDEGTCGNTIARFFTLFQQHYSADARIYSPGISIHEDRYDEQLFG